MVTIPFYNYDYNYDKIANSTLQLQLVTPTNNSPHLHLYTAILTLQLLIPNIYQSIVRYNVIFFFIFLFVPTWEGVTSLAARVYLPLCEGIPPSLRGYTALSGYLR